MKVSKLKTSDVIIPPGRMRVNVGNVDELKASITKHGQIHPITIDAKGHLIAGERRLQACKELEIDVLAVRRDDLSEQESIELELMENAARLDLSWQETVRAIHRLHKHNVKVHGKRWSFAKTAEAVGRSDEKVRLDFQLAEAIEDFPELEKFSRKTDAMRQLRNMYETLVEQELLERAVEEAVKGQKKHEKKEVKDTTVDDILNDPDLAGLDASDLLALIDEGEVEKQVAGEDVCNGNEPLSFFNDILTNGDLFQEIKSIADESIHLVVVDPPYGIEVDQTTADKYVGVFDDSKDWIHGFGAKLLAECHRVLVQNAHMYVFIALDFLPFWKEEAEKMGFEYDPLPLIWVKGAQVGRTGEPQKYPGRSYEAILYLRKGNLPLVKRGLPNVLIHNPVVGREKIHPTEKPPELLVDIIRRSAYPGSTVLDPCAGSGSTIQAALELGHKARGFELDSGIHAKAVHRLARWAEAKRTGK